MAIVLKDRVKQSAAAPGTGTITLGSTPAGFQAFSAIGNGNVTYFAIVDSASGAWEVNYGTYTSSGTTLTRNAAPLSSSASGALVNFTNTVDVFCTYPSENAVWRDTSGTVVQETFNNLTVLGTAALDAGTVNTVPTNSADIANKAYVDTVATGLHVHEAVYVSTTGTGAGINYADGGTTPTWTTITSTSEIATGSAHGLSTGAVIVFGSTTNGLTAGYGYFVKSTPTATSITISLFLDSPTIDTLTNGTGLSITSRANSGVGATLTAASSGTLTTIDGVAVTVGNRVLVWTFTDAYKNGIYTITSVGSPSTSYVLTRAADANTYDPRSDLGLGEGDYFFIQNGDTYKGDSVVLGTQGTIIFGTTNLDFNVFANSVVYSAGTGLTLTDTVFSITPAGTAGTYGSASQVPVFVTNASGQVTSVTNTSIAINGSAVSGAISGQAGSVANALTLGTYLTGTSFNGSAAVTATVDATSANTASKVVARDSSGNFSAGTITATLSGSSTSATTATNLAGGAANQIPYQSAASTTAFATAPSATGDLLNWTGSAFAWTQSPSITSITLSGGTANGVTYLNGSKVLTSGSALTFDGTNFATTGAITSTLATTGAITATGSNNDAISAYIENSNQTGAGAADRRLTLLAAGNTSYFGVAIWQNRAVIEGTSPGGMAIGTNTASAPLVFYAEARTEGMCLTSTGLGIGTSSPATKLDVNSTAAAVARLTRNGGTAANTSLQYYNGTNSWYAGMSAGGLYGIGYNDANLATAQLRLDSSGNLGLGITPSAWKSDQKVIQVGASASIQSNTGAANALLNSNVYFDSAGTLRYIATGFASRYQQYLGVHSWDIAASGTAGATISFTQAMTLDASGNLLVGGTAARATTAGTKHLDLFDGTAPAGTLTNGVSVYSSSGDLKFMNAAGDGFDVGYRNIPQNSQSAAYTTVLADSGKCIYHPTTDANARTFTIASNASVPYPIGTVIQFVNMTSQVVTIAINTDTMYLAGTGTTGSRSLAIYGVANAMKMTSTTWIITGSGLT